LARFGRDDFAVTYRLDGDDGDGISIRKWEATDPFPLPAYGPAGGSFTATVIQRRNSPDEPWFFVPGITLTHRDPWGSADWGAADYVEPAVTLGRRASMDDAVKAIKMEVTRRVNARAWDGAGPDDEWWDD